MNLHLPQTEEARAEAALLMIVSIKSTYWLCFIDVIFKTKLIKFYFIIEQIKSCHT